MLVLGWLVHNTGTRSWSSGVSKLVLHSTLTFADNGHGIPKEYQSKIFDRFFRAQKGNQYKGKGFGIGLSYVKSIVEAHGGRITLNEDYKDGCEFVVVLNS